MEEQTVYVLIPGFFRPRVIRSEADVRPVFVLFEVQQTGAVPMRAMTIFFKTQAEMEERFSGLIVWTHDGARTVGLFTDPEIHAAFSVTTTNFSLLGKDMVSCTLKEPDYKGSVSVVQPSALLIGQLQSGLFGMFEAAENKPEDVQDPGV